MANANVSFQGAVNNQAANEAEKRSLFYKQFSGEVFTAYSTAVTMENYQTVRHITSGKSVGFNHTGRAIGRQHVPGTEITGQEMYHAETIITVDNKMISDVFIADIYEAMNHYEVRGPYAEQLGQALARIYDKTAFRVAVMAARSANKITGLPGGTEITLPAGYDALSDLAQAQAFAEALFQARESYDTLEVPMESAVCFLTPKIYYQLVRHKDLLNKDWGGAGSFSQGELPMVAGIPLMKVNHIPSQDDAANVSGGMIQDGIDVIDTKYSGDYTKTRALILTKEATGCVKLMDLKMQQQDDIRRQGTLIVASYLNGMGPLRVEHATEIKVP